MCGMGGDLMALVVPPSGDIPLALNASGRAGSGADAEGLRADGHTTMPFRHDVRSVTVPGCVDGWLAMHERFGRLPLAQVLGPALRYAEDGFPASPTLAGAAPEVTDIPGADDFAKRSPLAVGDVVARPGAARTLAAILEEGRKGFYEGEFGRGLLHVGAGLFTGEDLAASCANWAAALGCEAWGHLIWTAPPNSQGYLTLASAWIASNLSLPDDPDEPLWGHLLVEAAHAASFDRADVLYEQADGADLVDPARLEPRLRTIDRQRANSRRGSFGSGGTAALCVVDEQRMAVSMLQSNAAGFGSLVVVPEVGIFLHNRGIGFSLRKGHPAEYGPRRRPPHTLSPTAVTTGDGRLRGVLGTMGGDSQPQILLQLLARWLGAGQEPGPAVAAGRWVLRAGRHAFDTWQEASAVRVMIEGHCPSTWPTDFGAAGHEVVVLPAFDRTFGFAQLITDEGGHLAGGSDPRPRFGGAAGY
jgi:gamma-glutamyltranspeptidase/glutathione hydrolase